MSPSGRDPGVVQVKAMVVLLDPAGDRLLVTRLGAPGGPGDPAPGAFHRLPGGGVELGETSVDAARREIVEELGVELGDLDRLGVLESIFTYDGRQRHEVVFVFAAGVTGDVVPPGGAWRTDDGDPLWVEWRSRTDPPDLPLYPEGALALLDAR